MKKIFFLAAVTAMLAACNQNSGSTITSDNTKDTTATTQTVTYPYTAHYSNNFEIGDAKYAQMVLKYWKDYDNNSFTEDDNFADSVSMDNANGSTFNGTKDSFMHRVAKYRGSLKNAVDSVEVFVVLKPKNKEGNWVCIWGTEYDNLKNGKTDTAYLNENWHFNKNDKIDYISQFASGRKK